jgi:Rieske Fe-S protein
MLKQIVASISVPAAILWFVGVNNKIKNSKKTKIAIPNNLPNGITFIDKIIVNKNEDLFTVFSSRCTHLGCKIKSSENDNLVCPCHGSKFSFDGTPLNGPATKPLTKLNIVSDKSSGELVVYV